MSNLGKNIAIKVPVIESEKGWGRKVDDYMVCLSTEDAKAFISEFNALDNEPVTPDWYMVASIETDAIDLNDAQYEKLKEEKRVWLSALKKLK